MRDLPDRLLVFASSLREYNDWRATHDYPSRQIAIFADEDTIRGHYRVPYVFVGGFGEPWENAPLRAEQERELAIRALPGLGERLFLDAVPTSNSSTVVRSTA